jgi:hypothetical protein
MEGYSESGVQILASYGATSEQQYFKLRRRINFVFFTPGVAGGYPYLPLSGSFVARFFLKFIFPYSA